MTYMRLDDAFLKFVRAYTKEEKFRRPAEIFGFIEKMKTDPLTACGEMTNYEEDGQIYWTEKDLFKRDAEFISKEEATIVDKRIVATERTMNSIGEFRRLLLENPINIIYAKEHEGERQILSNRLFATYHSFQELLSCRFFSYEGHFLYVDESTLSVTLDLFYDKSRQQMEEVNRVARQVERLKKDKVAYCMYKLFGLFEYQHILDKFPDDSSYAEQGEVATYLQNTYDISASFVVRNLLPSLKTLKPESLS